MNARALHIRKASYLVMKTAVVTRARSATTTKTFGKTAR